MAGSWVCSAPSPLWAGPAKAPVGVVPITKNAKRTIPLGILITCVVVSIVYGLMSYVAAGALPYDETANQNLSVTAGAIMSQAPFAFFVIGGVCAIISSFMAVLAMIREPPSHMTDDGWLPGIFRKKATTATLIPLCRRPRLTTSGAPTKFRTLCPEVHIRPKASTFPVLAFAMFQDIL